MISKNSEDILTQQINDFIKQNKVSKQGLEFFYRNNREIKNKNIPSRVIDNLFFDKDELVISDYNKLISIIITTYNRKKMLIEAIQSILNQTYSLFEIIIIDDNSNDGTEDEINKLYGNDHRIIYHNTRVNQGPGKNRLIGYQEYAKGDYIIFMDDDDFFIDNDYFNKCMKIYSQNNDISFIAANSFIFYENSNKVTISKLNLPYHIDRKEYFLNFQTKQYPKPNSTFTAIFNKVVLERVELENMKMMNDSSIYLRALMDSAPILLEDIVGVYRLHGHNITYSCSCEFILENIEEKMMVKELSYNKFNSDKSEMEKWFHSQLNTTIHYYLDCSKVSLNDYKKIIQWLKNNDVNYYNLNKIPLFKKFIKGQLRQCKYYIMKGDK